MQITVPFTVALLSVLEVSARTFKGGLLERRTTTDDCANLVNAPLKVSVQGIGQITVGYINACLCHSGVHSFEATNPVAIAAVSIVGTGATTSSLNNMINQATSHQTCSYPDLASPVCTASNPCSFTCGSGFTPYPSSHPTSCTCATPNKVCNGICVNANTVCPSNAPSKRSLAACNNGYSACGVFGWAKDEDAYECVDTLSDLESCGGCTLPLTAGALTGTDCSALPGVADVACRAGRCEVSQCMPDWKVSPDGTSCITLGGTSSLSAAYEFIQEQLTRVD